MLISYIIMKLGFNLDDEEAKHRNCFRDNDLSTAQSLMRMEMIEKTRGDGYRFKEDRPRRRARNTYQQDALKAPKQCIFIFESMEG